MEGQAKQPEVHGSNDSNHCHKMSGFLASCKVEVMDPCIRSRDEVSYVLRVGEVFAIGDEVA